MTAEQRELVTSHDKLALSIAHKYADAKNRLEDLFAEARLALCVAAGRFDSGRGLQFSTYAAYWVRAAIMEYKLRYHGQVRFGTNREDRAIYFRLGLARRLHGEDADAIAAYFGVSRDVLDRGRARIETADRSIDNPALTGGATASALIDGSDGADERLIAAESAARLRRRIERGLRRLPDRERRIAEARFLRDPRVTLQELGEEFGLSRERVRQIEKKVRVKMRVMFADLA
jgi:RNA polymerase sigma-32 factor